MMREIRKERNEEMIPTTGVPQTNSLDVKTKGDFMSTTTVLPPTSKDLTFNLWMAVKDFDELQYKKYIIDLNKEGDVDWIKGFGFVKFADQILTPSKKFGMSLDYHNYVKTGYWTGRTSSKNMLYCITIDGKITKIGMTTVGLSKRWSSYNNGTEKLRFKGSGSTTNYNVMQPLRTSIKEGRNVEWYCWAPPVHKYVNSAFGVTEEVVAKDPEWYENVLITEYEKKYGKKPFLSQNK